ncbi:septal ring lytic transglycosylase RlpA family protein [Marinomonas spartinae]|uniref:septal ring lytic transglycosylase RlpA family protein n=1 Tax=Marinomonas spartinae TaxID=1792290 RepID=UPI001FDFA8E8|nr:septal ring lytic transglycosylase RlpA family protein [Marinomonas spartinae]
MSNSAKPLDYDRASGGGRYSILQDKAPDHDVKVDHLPELVPKWEPRSAGGNKSPYEVWGKKYWVMKSAKGYVAEGTASWYGLKFHGHTTSNGEKYDMYAFSAANKTLPIPTYLKVTNLGNGRTVIVRVNDRGPFHGNRLIDLSYAAAVRLGFQKKGLAHVRIQAITVPKGATYHPGLYTAGTSKKEVNPPIVLASEHAKEHHQPVKKSLSFNHLQAGAFSTKEAAERLKNRLIQVFDTQIKITIIKQSDGLFKVFLGPYSSDDALVLWQKKLQKAGFTKPIRVALIP